MKRVAILGCTGSIGTQALDVCRRNPDKLQVVALAANSSVEPVVATAREFGCSHVALADPLCKGDAALEDLPAGCECTFGDDAVAALATLPEVDIVLVAVVGAIGIRASLEGAKAGKVLAQANKEALVVGGDLIMPLLSEGQMLPVDSEHSAIFQCLAGQSSGRIARIWLTCSGGPFFGWTADEVTGVTCEQALGHPKWSMGPKITIDSATLMNKGLEVIEAHHLFGVSIDDVEVLIHRESRIHSMVEFTDGSVIAQLADTDMRGPIQYAMSYPDRWDAPMHRVDFLHESPLSFAEPDRDVFRCLELACSAGRAGGTLPCAMNAANEVANLAFRQGAIGFAQIPDIVESVMEQTNLERVSSLEQLEDVDRTSRALADHLVKGMAR